MSEFPGKMSQVYLHLAWELVKHVELRFNETFETLHLAELSPTPYQRFIASELSVAFAYGLFPFALMYLSFLAQVKSQKQSHNILTALTLIAYAVWPRIAPVDCPPFASMQYFGVLVGGMKTLDIWMRRKKPLRYVHTDSSLPQPSDALIALFLSTELRYESFTPNRIRVKKESEDFSEPWELAIHIGAFAVLQALPQKYPIILAFEVLLSIYIIWTALQMVLRYKTSPSLFGPLYRAESLAGFWSDSWHNAFTSMCESLGYAPARYWLPKLGFSLQAARIGGILASFAIMATFHVAALWPLLSSRGLYRIGMFFMLNGVATVAEAAVWGRKSSWTKTLLAWTFEVAIATWAAKASNIPNGLSQIRWTNLCDSLGSPCKMTPLANEI